MSDQLAKLPDRGQLLEALREQLAASVSAGKPLALLIIRLVRYDKLTREYGFEAASQVLNEMLRRIRKITRSGDALGRTAGTDFGLVLPGLVGVGQAILAAQKITQIAAKQVTVDGARIKISVAVGIAMYPEHSSAPAELIRYAERAATEAEGTSDGYELYSGEDDATVQRSLSMEGELDQAIKVGDIQIHYQPKVDLKTLRYSGLEALARWHSPTLGTVRSDTFIDLAEKTGLIQPLTMLIMNIALREYNEIQQHAPDTSISINLSAAILHEEELLDLILRALDVWQIAPERLTLEVTETAVMSDTARSLRTLERLSAERIQISMDDFGTGQSSLRYLKSLPLRELKIDKSFVLNMMSNEDDVKISRAIIDLAHIFDLYVVAEGIENEPTMARLAELGCEYGQGFHIGRPMPLPDFIAWLQKWQAGRN